MEFQDDYEHLNNEIFYTTENIISESLCNEQISEGCTCEKTCKLESCDCLQKSGAVYKNNSEKDLYNSYFIEEINSNKPFYECNNNCKCLGSFCGNRLVQFGPRKNLEIMQTNNEKGLGLTTTRSIKRGNFICEYAGEVISECEAKERYKCNQVLGKMNFIFCINEYFGEKNYKTFIDPSVFGNIGRYINHSCEANCVLYPIRVDSAVTPKLCIFAKADIDEFSEITFDYGNENSVPTDHLTNRIPCVCNTQNCRKYLPYCPQI